MVRLNRLLPGLTLVGALLLALPAEAARLQFWRFDTEENQLLFTTDDSVQPTAQLLSNPTRLVIDLPGTTVIDPDTQAFGGAVKEVRVGKLDAETTRLVVEYNSGYTVDPDQVQVRGEGSRQWTVQLPDPIEFSESVVRTETTSPASEVTASNRVSNRPVQGAQTRIQGITATSDGFFIRTAGEAADIDVSRSEEDGQRYITMTFDRAAIALGLTRARLPVTRYSVNGWQLDQVSADPPRPKSRWH